MSEAVDEKQTHKFGTEVDDLLHLVIHSLYSNREIFLRELISNASDALDKLKFLALSDDALYEGNVDLQVSIEFDKTARTVTIHDNGVGMSKEEVVSNIGTIARSGTKQFLKQMSEDTARNAEFIGQFGVGFYASFIVADFVTLETRRAGASPSEGVRWSSAGTSEYELETINKPTRGTSITLHLKADANEYLDAMRLRHIVTKYSDHIAYPITMLPMDFGSEGEDETQDKTPEVVNRATALWTIPKSDIEDEAYEELYKHLSHDYEGPLSWAHNKVEGKLEYTTLLYVPKTGRYDIWNPERTRGLKLYVRRVFIMDDADQFLPNYLRFVKGVIDSSDLPLNISREILQGNQMVDSMKQGVTKRCLSLLEEIATQKPEDYKTFWSSFGQILKEGPVEDISNKDRIAKLLRFSSTHTDTPEQEVSFEDYIARMPEGQTKIYYMAADNFNAAKSSPHLEAFRTKGIEVILMYNRIDEWMMSHYTAFEGKSFQSVAKGQLDDLSFKTDSDLNEDKEKLDLKSKDFQDTLNKLKLILGERVKDVRLTNRLTNSAACIVSDDSDMTRQMERLMQQAGQEVSFKPILELNSEHPLVLRLQASKDDSQFDDLGQVLFDSAVLAEGGQLADPGAFVHRFNELLLKGL